MARNMFENFNETRTNENNENFSIDNMNYEEMSAIDEDIANAVMAVKGSLDGSKISEEETNENINNYDEEYNVRHEIDKLIEDIESKMDETNSEYDEFQRLKEQYSKAKDLPNNLPVLYSIQTALSFMSTSLLLNSSTVSEEVENTNHNISGLF